MTGRQNCNHPINVILTWFQVAVETGCSRMQYAVLSWNKSSIDFYIKHGAVNLTEKENWHMFRLEGEALEKLAKE